MKIRLINSLYAGLTFIVLNSGCNTEKDKNQATEEKKVQSVAAERLAKTYCATCHLYPEPHLLDKTSWKKYVLPRMGYFWGIYPHDSVRQGLIESGSGGQMVEAAKVFPEKELLPEETYSRIVDFYLENAPDQLPDTTNPEKSILRLFDIHIPNFRMSPPSTTMVSINPDQTVYLGDAHTKSFYQFSAGADLLQAARLKEGAVWLEALPDQLLILVMGSFSPTDDQSGFLISLSLNEQGKAKVLIDDLQRPVHFVRGDLDQDQLPDLVICEFAKWTGSLSWWKNLGNGSYQRKVLRNKPGATKSYIRDLNKDGFPDVVALFGQGDEGIFAFYNDGKGNFKEKNLLRFSPSHGSSYFNFYDFNGDGADDIIYTAGDNADFRPVLKPYHGIYIFQNDGQNQFHQTFFYSLNGAYAAFPDDFDLDGDTDIAAISFFPDFTHHPEEGFVWLENQGDFTFKPHHLPQQGWGRWIVMDQGDIDLDGDQDLVLGSLAFEVISPRSAEFMQEWVNAGIPYILLKNNTIQ
ncbi:MAG: FG-GAP repeat domain-containing protein [Candidatus Cyclobacteriaceae bacterium M3_2C_046]